MRYLLNAIRFWNLAINNHFCIIAAAILFEFIRYRSYKSKIAMHLKRKHLPVIGLYRGTVYRCYKNKTRPVYCAKKLIIMARQRVDFGSG